MTVCIAAIYGKDQGIIAVADKMFTSAPGILTVHEVNENNKILQLNKTTIAMIAGNVTNASSIVTELIAQTKDNDKIESVALKAAEIYKKHLAKAIEDNALSRWGLTVDEFMEKQKSLDQQLVNNLNQVILQANLEVSIIIAGCDSVGPRLFIVDNPGNVSCLDATGIVYAGSGSAHASLSTVDSRYQKSNDFGEVLYTVFKAKKKAEYDPNVGKYTSVCVIEKKVQEYTDDEIKSLNTEYEKSESDVKLILEKVKKKLGKNHHGNSSTKTKQ